MSDILNDWKARKKEATRRSVEDYEASWGVASTDGPTCPHCGNEITPDEGLYYDENRYMEDTCGECEKPFRVELHIQYTWTTYRELED